MKDLINEEGQDLLKLAPFIYKAISTKRTSLGDNKAFPPYGDFGFEYDVVKKKYGEIDDKINKLIEYGEIESKDTDYLLSILSKKFEECKKLEEPIRPQLQKLCENIINKAFSVPSETIIFKSKLVGKIKPKKGMRILPEGDDEKNTYDFEDVDEVILANDVILKRRFINSLIQGISYWLSTDIDEWFDEVNKLNKKLLNLWLQIKYISDYLLFVKEEKISEKNPMQMSYVEVTIGKKGRKTIIDAQGLIFPYLLRDSFRGFLELFSSHGLPNDNKKAMYIIRRADFIVAEPWDLRLGMGIVDVLKDTLTNKYQTGLLCQTNMIPFFFTWLCKLKTDEFNDMVQNFLLGTKKGKILAKKIDSDIVHDVEYQKFKDKIHQKNIDKSLISDGYFSKEELDSYVIQENETNEMMAYHGTGADFDKFNHKKYLDTGAGSQTFGWGTYVTNDEEVAKGYSENSKTVGVDTEHEIENFLIVNYNYDSESAQREAHDIIANFRWAGSWKEFIELCEKGITADWNNDEQKERDKRWLNILKSIRKENAFLYEVDIPEDNGQNYIEWYGQFPSEFMRRILNGFLKIHDKYLNLMAEKNYPFKCDLYQDIQWMRQNPDRTNKMIDIISNGDYEDFFSSSYYTNKALTDGKSVYRRLQTIFFNSDKAASLFLMQCGFDGLKYPSGTKWRKPDGASEDAYNYVIFDANKVKIVNKTRV